MKNIFQTLITAISLMAISSCSDDQEIAQPAGPVLVQFFQEETMVFENLANHEITLVFNKKTAVEGTITLAVTTDYGDDFTTTPVTENGMLSLPVAAGLTSVSFRINPIDNQLLEGNKQVSFSIHELSDGFMKGERQNALVTIQDDELPAIVSFANAQASLNESKAEGLEVIINFSGHAFASGLIEIDFNESSALYDELFTTMPEASNGKIMLDVSNGDTYASFMIYPVNNQKLNGHKNILFNINAATGAVKKESDSQLALKLIDDELDGKLKSFEIQAGDRYKESFEYNEDGQIAKIEWEQNTPFLSSGTKEFVYDHEGKLISMVESSSIQTNYIWSNGQIVKSERKVSGVIKEYSEFFYNAQGKIISTTFYYRQPSGEFTLQTVIDYEYAIDGNLFKSIHQSPSSIDGQLFVYSSRIYGGFAEGNMVAPMINILPNYNPHHKLVTFYKVEEYGHTFTYHISYQLNEQGLPLSRIASSPSGNQTTTYTYY
ncbi:MAG TPA: hypothetical protein PKC24_10160 [Cyclobacteriaceae bacterium]|nr:hypothetical protein [Cyclobacteriaceae bacterium]